MPKYQHYFLADPRREDSCQFLISVRWPQDRKCGGHRDEHIGGQA